MTQSGTRCGGTARLAIVLVITAAMVAAPLSGLVGAQETAPTSISDVQVSAGGNATAVLSIEEVPEGLAGFAINVSVEDDSVADLSGVTYSDQLGLTEAVWYGDNETVTVKGTDVQRNFEEGDQVGEVVQLEVTGERAGETNLTVDGGVIDEDGGDKLVPGAARGSVNVTSSGFLGGGSPVTVLVLASVGGVLVLLAAVLRFTGIR